MISDVTVESIIGEDCKVRLFCKSNGDVAEHVAKAFELFNSSCEITLRQQRALIEKEFLERINKVNDKASLEKQDLLDQIKRLTESIETTKSEQKAMYENEINNLKAKQLALAEENENKIRTMEENVQQEVSVKSMRFECDLKMQIAELKSQLQVSKVKLDNANAIDSIVKHIDKNYENINKFFSSSNEELGTSGEQFVQDTIQQFIYLSDNSYIENVSGQPDSCDLLLKYRSCVTAVEVKNHAYPIKKDLVKRFIDKDMLNEKYNSGIFISLKTDFSQASGVGHFTIRFVKNKPCIFIANAFQKKEHISIAIKMIDYLISNQNRDKTFINHIIQTINSMVSKLDSLTKHNNSMLKIIRESGITISEIKQEIESIIDDGSKKYKHMCECGKGFDKKVEYNRHVKNEHK